MCNLYSRTNAPEEARRSMRILAWPAYEAMARRIPRGRASTEEPAHTFRPARFFGETA